MRSFLPTAAMLIAGCPGPDDSAAQDCTRVDETIGSIVHVCWEQPEQGTANVSYRVAGEDWRPTLVDQHGAGSNGVVLLGLPYDVEVEFEVRDVAGDTLNEGSIHTEPLPAELPDVEILASDPELQDPDTPYLLTSIDHLGDADTTEGTWAFILDRDGRIVWALETEPFRLTVHPRISADGAAILMDLNSHFGSFDRGVASQVLRVGIDGVEQARWDTPGLHHPFTDRPDGTLAWGAWGEGLETLEVLDPEGVQRTLWDCTDFHAARGMPDTPCSSNTLCWSEDRGSFLFSLYTTHTVVEIDGDSGETLRWFGQMPDGWAFEPEDSGFIWQHGAYITAEGTLLASMRASTASEETVVREYSLDPDAETLTQLWSFGEGQGVFAPELGEAIRLPGGNTLHNYGTDARIREVTPDGELAWDLMFSPGSWLGRSSPIPDLYALWPEGS
jgi:hypothetical protein